jgi:hypothetical protein
MSEFKPSATSATILGSGKSSRLLEMRNKSLNLHNDTTSAPDKSKTTDKLKQNPDLLLAQQLIDQRMAEILASLPTNKQRSLFKIRFGFDPDNLHQQPIGQLIKSLKIQHPKFERPSAEMKNVLQLTYGHL